MPLKSISFNNLDCRMQMRNVDKKVQINIWLFNILHYKCKCLCGVGCKSRDLSFQEGVLHTYTRTYVCDIKKKHICAHKH